MTKELNHFYYQIDYIDKDGLATYIDMFHDIDKGLLAVGILNRANECINKDTKFVLDKYGTHIEDSPYEDDYDNVLVESNITEALTINERVENAKG